MNAPDNSPTQQQIAERAYEIYLLEGEPDGHSMEHWLQAETELKERLRKMPVHIADVGSQRTGSNQNRRVSRAAPISETAAFPKDGLLHGDKKTGKTGERANATGNRDGIQEVAHRVMGSRQSGRSVERSGQRRQPKRGHGSQKAKE